MKHLGVTKTRQKLQIDKLLKKIKISPFSEIYVQFFHEEFLSEDFPLVHRQRSLIFKQKSIFTGRAAKTAETLVKESWKRGSHKKMRPSICIKFWKNLNSPKSAILLTYIHIFSRGPIIQIIWKIQTVQETLKK